MTASVFEILALCSKHWPYIFLSTHTNQKITSNFQGKIYIRFAVHRCAPQVRSCIRQRRVHIVFHSILRISQMCIFFFLILTKKCFKLICATPSFCKWVKASASYMLTGEKCWNLEKLLQSTQFFPPPHTDQHYLKIILR